MTEKVNHLREELIKTGTALASALIKAGNLEVENQKLRATLQEIIDVKGSPPFQVARAIARRK